MVLVREYSNGNKRAMVFLESAWGYCSKVKAQQTVAGVHVVPSLHNLFSNICIYASTLKIVTSQGRFPEREEIATY
jgi:hypothetical protein